MQKYYKRIIGNKLALAKFIWVVLLNGYIPLLKSPEVKLILNNWISKPSELLKCVEFDHVGVEKGEKKTSNIDFLSMF